MSNSSSQRLIWRPGRAGVAHLVERDIAKVEAAGSKSVSRSKFVLTRGIPPYSNDGDLVELWGWTDTYSSDGYSAARCRRRTTSPQETTHCGLQCGPSGA